LGLAAFAGPAAAADTPGTFKIYRMTHAFSTTKNPNGVWSFARGASGYNSYDLLQPIIPNGFAWPQNAAGWADMPAVSKPGATDKFLTVLTTWWDLVFIRWTAPRSGTASVDAVFYNIGSSDIHYRLLQNGIPLSGENSLLGSNRGHPVKLSYSGLRVAKDDVIWAWFYPENCCGDYAAANLQIVLTPD
jgi:hypothetical protein